MRLEGLALAFEVVPLVMAEPRARERMQLEYVPACNPYLAPRADVRGVEQHVARLVYQRVCAAPAEVCRADVDREHEDDERESRAYAPRERAPVLAAVPRGQRERRRASEEREHPRACRRVPEPPRVEGEQEKVRPHRQLPPRAAAERRRVDHVKIYSVHRRHRHPEAEHLLLPRVADVVAGHVHDERADAVHVAYQKLGEDDVHCGVEVREPKDAAQRRLRTEEVVAENIGGEQRREEEPFLEVGRPGEDVAPEGLQRDEGEQAEPYRAEEVEAEARPLRDEERERGTAGERYESDGDHRPRPLHDVQRVEPVRAGIYKIWKSE